MAPEFLKSNNEIKQYYAGKQVLEGQNFWKKRELRVLHAIVNCAIIVSRLNIIKKYKIL